MIRAVGGPCSRVGAWLGRPMTSFHLIVSIAALLTTLGLIMVLSASGVRSYDDDGSAWVIFGRQVLWTLIGLVACYLALRVPVRFMRRAAFSGFALTIVLLVLVLVPGIGHYANGSRGWFVVAGFSMQPSELTKIAFAIWGAHLLAARRMERASLREMLIPLVPAAVIALALIVAQPDLGQTVSLGIILLALLWYAGLPLRVFVSSLFAVIVSGAILAVSEGYRSDRVRSWLNPDRIRRTPATRPARQSSRWPTAASSVTVSVRAPRNGTTCPTPTTTSFSRSSAKSWALSARSRCWRCSACSPTPGCASPAGRPTRSCGC
ncbi:cell cycle family protein [Mycobacterium xenopi 3993]|nr:cell cycle family protein [Mycobacterium xenopi 3993]